MRVFLAVLSAAYIIALCMLMQCVRPCEMEMCKSLFVFTQSAHEIIQNVIVICAKTILCRNPFMDALQNPSNCLRVQLVLRHFSLPLLILSLVTSIFLNYMFCCLLRQILKIKSINREIAPIYLDKSVNGSAKESSRICRILELILTKSIDFICFDFNWSV